MNVEGIEKPWIIAVIILINNDETDNVEANPPSFASKSSVLVQAPFK